VRSELEVADIFRHHGPAWRATHSGHVSLAQLRVVSAIETCRTAALGGHVEGCEDCGHTRIAYNSCPNRHCPKCQGAAAREWLAAREAVAMIQSKRAGRCSRQSFPTPWRPWSGSLPTARENFR
jgi:hypothetical protein